MIARLWHGWTSESNSEAYASLLTAGVLPELTRTEECHGAYVLRRRTESAEVEYTVLMFFQDIDAVKRMAGADYECSVVPLAFSLVLVEVLGMSQLASRP